MSPFQHGEVFVTEDGAETDLDLGHYERFTSAKMGKRNNFTTGQIYESVIKKERRGEYLQQDGAGDSAHHRRDQALPQAGAEGADVAIVEVGGTVGDIESLPFLEAIRQMGIEEARGATCFIHLTLVPYIPTAGELKTKPTQHSVKELRQIGIQPDILLCQAEIARFRSTERRKIALFCNSDAEAVIETLDADSIYKIPGMLHEQMLDEIVCHKLGISRPCGRSVGVGETHRRAGTSRAHRQRSGSSASTWILPSPTSRSSRPSITPECIPETRSASTISIPRISNLRLRDVAKHGRDPGAGRLWQAWYGRQDQGHRLRSRKIDSYLGICLGMQLAVVEYACNVVGLEGAHSTEFDKQSKYPVIGLITAVAQPRGKGRKRGEDSDLGGTMRLGGQVCKRRGSLARKVRQGRNRRASSSPLRGQQRPARATRGKRPASLRPGAGHRSVRDDRASDHPWFVGCQFHPEFTSNPRAGHPLFPSIRTRRACSTIGAASRPKSGKVAA